MDWLSHKQDARPDRERTAAMKKSKVKVKHVAGKADLFKVNLPKQQKKGAPKALSTQNTVSLIGPKTGGKSIKQFKKENKNNPEVLQELPHPRKGKKRQGTFKLPKQESKEQQDVSDFDPGDEEQATEDQLANITKEARKAVALEKQIADLKAATETLEQERWELISKTLPGLLDSAGLTDFTLEDGSSIGIKEVVRGSLPSADKRPAEREAAIAWLLENGGSGIIKTQYNTEFGVGQEKLAKIFETIITKAKFVAKKTTGVHPQTLCAFVREKLENGETVPVDKLGIYAGRHAMIKLSGEAQEEAEAERVKPKRRV